MATVQIIGGGTQMNIFFCLGCLLILIGILTVETAEWTKTAKTSVSASGIAKTSGACSGMSGVYRDIGTDVKRRKSFDASRIQSDTWYYVRQRSGCRFFK